jgi:ABC-type transporter MlaC component
MWSGQDPAATDITITATSDPAVVGVQFYHPGISDPMKLTFMLAKGPAGWRITDISGDGWDLVEVLRRP